MIEFHKILLFNKIIISNKFRYILNLNTVTLGVITNIVFNLL